MILIAKPHKAGSVQTGQDNLTDLLSGPAAELLQPIDFGEYGNPDGAMGSDKVSSYPDFRGGHPVGALRSQSQSGGGKIHPTNKTTAPMGRPAGFVAGPDSVKTAPRSIKK